VVDEVLAGADGGDEAARQMLLTVRACRRLPGGLLLDDAVRVASGDVD
jgi:hypothetical protein